MSATDGDELQVLVDELARRLKRSVAADDRDMLFLVASRHFGDEDPARIRAVLNRNLDAETAHFLLKQGIRTAERMVRVPGSDAHQLKPRRCFPMRWNGNLMGWLWLLGAGDEHENDLAATCAERMAQVLYMRALRGQGAWARREGLIRDLLLNAPQSASRTRSELLEMHWVDQGASVCVLVFESDLSQSPPSEVVGPLGDQLAAAAVSVPTTRMDSAIVGAQLAVILSGPHTDLEEHAEFVARYVIRDRKSRDLSGVAVGIGSVQPLEQASLSFKQAALCVRAGHVIDGLGAAIAWRTLGPWSALVEAAERSTAEMLLPQPLIDLVEQDRNHTLLATAETYLDVAGDSRLAATRLHIHRTTLYYRLQRISEITGLDLTNGEHRLTLHLGIKLRRLSAAAGSAQGLADT